MRPRPRPCTAPLALARTVGPAALLHGVPGVGLPASLRGVRKCCCRAALSFARKQLLLLTLHEEHGERRAPKAVAQRPRLSSSCRVVEIQHRQPDQGTRLESCAGGSRVAERAAWPVGIRSPGRSPGSSPSQSSDFILQRGRIHRCGPLRSCASSGSLRLTLLNSQQQPREATSRLCVAQPLWEDDLQLFPYPLPGSVYVQCVCASVPGNVEGTRRGVI